MKTKVLLFLLLSLPVMASAQSEEASSSPTSDVTANADTLLLPGYEQLDELVIEGERPVMQTDGAKLTYNVEEDPASDSSNVLDILKKVPQISVDGDGNVLLNGSSAFKFQVNGLDNPMLKQYGSQIFQAMPASSVLKIEVITEPGAKEDAEGTAGIINIITERTKSNDGYNGRISLQAGPRTLTPSLYGIFKKDKFTLSANLNYQWGFGEQKGENTTDAKYLQTADGGTLHSLTGQKAKHQFVGGNIDMSWEPNSDNLLTAGVNLFYIDANLTSLYGTTMMTGSDGQPIWSFGQQGHGSLSVLNLSANASYRHNFGREGNNIIVSYLFNFGNTDLTINRLYHEFYNYYQEYSNQENSNNTFSRGHTVQVDYSDDFNSEHHKLDVGAKGIFRHNTAMAGYLYGNNENDMIRFPDEDTDIYQPQNIYAAYASYTGIFGHLGVVGGLRYEHTYMGVTDRIKTGESFRNRLIDWVPNAALTWNFSPASNLRLAYQMRISRPSIDQVNPFELSFSPYEVRKGNPDLTSERNHIVSLKYSQFGRLFGGSIGMEYNVNNNAISSFTYLQQVDDINTIFTTYANIGKKQRVSLTGFLNWNIISHMNLSLNGLLSYNTLKAPSEGFRNHGWSGNIGANWNYTVADVYKFSAYGSWNSRQLTVQGYSSGFYYYGISAARDFLADKSLTLSLSANNFLQKSMTYKSFTETPGIIYRSNGKNLSAWGAGISISWKFGSLNTRVKKTGIDLENDDINTSSNKGAGGGTI